MRYFILFVLCFSVILSAAEYDKIISQIKKYANDNPKLVKMIDIGKNDQGNLILGVRIENPDVSGTKTNHLLVGTHHGNERQSAYLCTRAIGQLIEGFKNTGNQYHKGLAQKVLYVVPVLNIGGFNAYRRSERDKFGSSHDPNRDYPDACVKNSYFKLASIQNLVNFVERNNIISAITVHGYIGTFTYPWGIYTNQPKTQDDKLYSYIGKECCKINRYRTGTHTEVIYPAAGAFEDWSYHKFGIWTMLLELSRSANLDKDAQACVKFFTMVPLERSKQHAHTGKCTSSIASGKSRP